MDKKLDDVLKTSFEIGKLACQLDFNNQCYILGTINALLFMKEKNKEKNNYD